MTKNREKGYAGAAIIVSLHLGAVAPCQQAQGSPVTWEFAGEITFVRDDDNLLGGAVTVGTPFSGSYTFESTTPDVEPNRGDLGLYPGAVTSISGAIGSMDLLGLLAETNMIEVRNRITDSYLLNAEVTSRGMTFGYQVTLANGPNTIFESDDLPLSPPDPSVFAFATFKIFTGSELGPAVSVVGQVASLTPDPSTLCLLGVGASLLLRRRHRRSARVHLRLLEE